MARWPSKDLVAVVVSVLALVLSGVSFLAAGRPADIKLVLVERVHLSTSPGARLYLQPTFVSTAANERAEVIDAIDVTMTRTGDPTTYHLRWAETGTFDVGPFPDYAVDWKITALEPQPIVVTPAAPQTPVLQLYVADGFDWQPGRLPGGGSRDAARIVGGARRLARLRAEGRGYRPAPRRGAGALRHVPGVSSLTVPTVTRTLPRALPSST